MAVLDPGLEVVRLERFHQVIEGSVVTGQSRLVQQMSVTRGIIHAKKTFMTSLGRFKGRAAAITRPHTVVSKDCKETGSAESPPRPTGPPSPGTVRTDRGAATRDPKAPVGREIGKGGTKGGGGEGKGITRSVGSPRCRVALLPASSIGGGASVEDKRDEVRPAGGTTEVNGSPSPQKRCTRRAHPPPDGQSRRSSFGRNIATAMHRGTGGGKSSPLDPARRQQHQQQQQTRWNGGNKSTAPGKGAAASDNRAGDTPRQDMRTGGGGRGKQSAAAVKEPSDCGSHITCIAVSQWLQVAATGSLNGEVVVWDLRGGSSTSGLGLMRAHNGYQVNSICFLEPHPALATCNLEGAVAIWRMGLPESRNALLEQYHDGGSSEESVLPQPNGVDPNAELGTACDQARTDAATVRPCSANTWRCVALFHNNMRHPPHELSGDSNQGRPVPSAVNCLAWSRVEERLFTGDTDGMVKVWDVKNALTRPQADVDSRNDRDGRHPPPEQDARSSVSTSFAGPGSSRSSPPSSSRKVLGVDQRMNTTNRDSGAPECSGSTGQGNGQGGLQALATPAEDDSVIDSDDRNEALSETGGQHDTDSEAEHTSDEEDDDDGDRGARGGGQTNEGTAVSRHWRSAKDNSYISDFGEESIDGQLLGDRFGRGLGLLYIRCVGGWRPVGWSRQEVTTVRIFEGHNIAIRKNTDAGGNGEGSRGGARVGVQGTYRERKRVGGKTRTRDKDEGVKNGANRECVVVATITPDRLVRFWSTKGVALGNLDQEFATAQHPDTAARPLESWRMSVVSNQRGDYPYVFETSAGMDGVNYPRGRDCVSSAARASVGEGGSTIGTSAALIGDRNCVPAAGQITCDNHGTASSGEHDSSINGDGNTPGHGIVAVADAGRFISSTSSMARKWAMKYRPPESTSSFSTATRT